VFHSHYEALGLVGPGGHEEQMSTVKGMKVLALSAIGNPGYFSSLLKKNGLEVVKELSYPDHHSYSSKDLALIEEEGKEADRVVTTEKDMVKLKDLQTRLASLRSLSIEVRIWEQDEFFKKVMERF
jgi:tetraacyldisaccharide-1-P 4'-kinase